MSKESGMGRKRIGSRSSKGLGKCTGKHSHQCGSGIDLDTEHYEYKHKKHNFDESLHENPIHEKHGKK